MLLCTSNTNGISRQHGVVRYDRHQDVVYLGCAHSTSAVTFVNSIRLPPDAPPRVLVQGDTLGFGGSTLSAPGMGTVSYSVDLSSLPPLVQIGRAHV